MSDLKWKARCAQCDEELFSDIEAVPAKFNFCSVACTVKWIEQLSEHCMQECPDCGRLTLAALMVTRGRGSNVILVCSRCYRDSEKEEWSEL